MYKLFFLHFIADFVLQSREMGKKKSSEAKWLLSHLAIQFLVFIPFTNWKFALVNTIIHGFIDSNIWNGYKALAFWRIKQNPQHPLLILNDDFQDRWKYWDDHLFYTFIGLDQMLHGLTLIYVASKFL